jgi:hypothetical protein
MNLPATPFRRNILAEQEAFHPAQPRHATWCRYVSIVDPLQQLRACNAAGIAEF